MAVRFDKPDNGPERIGEVLARLFMARGWGEKRKRAALEDAWFKAAESILGSAARVATKPGSLRKSVLEIHVRDSVLMHEITQFHKRPLLARLRELLPGEKIGELRVRNSPGEFRPSPGKGGPAETPGV
jgi:hypothetical protein